MVVCRKDCNLISSFTSQNCSFALTSITSQATKTAAGWGSVILTRRAREPGMETMTSVSLEQPQLIWAAAATWNVAKQTD